MSPLEGMLGLVALVVAGTASSATELPESFSILSYQQIVDKLHALNQRYPNLVHLDNAQANFSIRSPGQCGKDQCRQWFVRLTNEDTLAAANGTRPQVFLSGCVHGNERVGPTTVTQWAVALLQNYHAPPAQRSSWLAYLLDHREIWILPTANALGYYRSQRTENGIDPNRDFPFDQRPSECMKTTAAQAINELWRRNMFQLAITFHGGMRAISYEWGSWNHQPRNLSPDDSSQRAIANAMQHIAGRSYYPAGRMNPLVYPVHGGMEDWAYAGSWDNTLGQYGSPRQPCQVPGYSASRTQYTADMLRGYNYLVETADQKIPTTGLGSSTGWMTSTSSGDGHIPRNMRLCALVSELVEPYVRFSRTSQHSATDPDHLPQVESGSQVVVKWLVGGGFSISSTHVMWTRLNDQEATIACATKARMAAGFWSERVNSTDESSQLNGSNSWTEDGISQTSRPWHQFEAMVAMPSVPGVYAFGATANNIDQDWGTHVPGSDPFGFNPQGHVSNARTNPGWDREVGDHHVRGRQDFLSDIMCVRVHEGTSGPSSSPTVSAPDTTPGPPDTTPGHDENQNVTNTADQPNSPWLDYYSEQGSYAKGFTVAYQTSAENKFRVWIVVAAAGIVVVGIIFGTVLWWKRRYFSSWSLIPTFEDVVDGTAQNMESQDQELEPNETHDHEPKHTVMTRHMIISEPDYV